MSCSSSSASEDEDEGIDSYRKGGYHAVRIGDQFAGGRYIAQGKLGWGQFSTVWLAYDTRTSVRFSSSVILFRFDVVIIMLLNKCLVFFTLPKSFGFKTFLLVENREINEGVFC